MKQVLLLLFLLVAILGCSDIQQAPSKKTPATDSIPESIQPFLQCIHAFPSIKDTAQFIQSLRKSFELDVHESPVQKENEKITVYKKVKIYGSDKDYFFIEYDWTTGSMVSFPWKYQLLITDSGKLIKKLTAQRFDFVEIFRNQHPFLLAVIGTARGNGWHDIYKVSADTLENVYEGSYDFKDRTYTYDAYEDLSVFEPNELKMSFIDDNKDGLKDIVFTGQKLMLGKYTKSGSWYDVENGMAFSVEHPASRHPIKYVFLYNEKSKCFKAKENYNID